MIQRDEQGPTGAHHENWNQSRGDEPQGPYPQHPEPSRGSPGAVGTGSRQVAFHTLRTLRGPVRSVLRLLSLLFGFLTVLGVVAVFSSGSWLLFTVGLVLTVIVNAVRWGYDSSIARTAPPGTQIITRL